MDARTKVTARRKEATDVDEARDVWQQLRTVVADRS
jgi:hypothetical protein